MTFAVMIMAMIVINGIKGMLVSTIKAIMAKMQM